MQRNDEEIKYDLWHGVSASHVRYAGRCVEERFDTR
jgi:hypothetical protein